MTLVSNSRSDKVMVFIDIRNMMKSASTIGPSLMLDYKLMTNTLVGNRELVAAYIFDTEKPYGVDDFSRRLHDSLSYQGFRVMTRDAYDPLKKEQKEVDVAMACEMLAHALHNHYDVAIVASGDGDFVPAVQHVQAAGKTVEIAAFSKNMNVRLRRFADRYYPLEKYPFLSLTNYPNEKPMIEKKKKKIEEAQKADVERLAEQEKEAEAADGNTYMDTVGEQAAAEMAEEKKMAEDAAKAADTAAAADDTRNAAGKAKVPATEEKKEEAKEPATGEKKEASQ